MRRPPIFGPWRLIALLLIVPAAWTYVWALSPAAASVECRTAPLEARDGMAAAVLVCLPPLPKPAFVAGALACPVGVEGPDCSVENAFDFVRMPVVSAGECGLVGQVLGTRLTLAPGQRLKITCERRKPDFCETYGACTTPVQGR